MKKLYTLTVLFLLLLCHGAKAQELNVTGTVYDPEGKPLPGVTVVVVESPLTGATTLQDGTYTISAREGQHLKFSFIGMEEQISMVTSSRKIIDVTLSENQELMDEVVVIGYGTARRKDVTGSVVSVGAKALEKAPVISLNEALQGKAAGVFVNVGDNSPGGGVSVLIRGKSSITQGNDPIYVVDGVIMSGTLNHINVNDIASIDILKDASAAAIYGSRAANGVVIVTTKKGQAGTSRINFSARTSVRKPLNLPKMLTAQQLAEIRVEGRVNDELNTFWEANPNITQEEYRREFHSLKDKYLSDLPLDMFSEVERKTLLDGETYDWLDPISHNGVIQDYSLSFSGATDKTNYFVSGNLFDNMGVIKGSRYKRLTTRVNFEHQLKPWLTIGTNTAYTRGIYQYGNSTIGEGLGANPLYPLYIDGKSPLELPFFTSEGRANPILSRNIDNDGTSNRFSTNTYLSFRLLDNLILRSSIAVDVAGDFQGYFVPNDIKQGLADKGIARITNKEWTDVLQENNLTYTEVFGSVHRLTAMIGNTIQVNNYKGNEQYGTGFATNIMGYKNISAASDFPAAFQWSNSQQWKSASFITRVNYTYDDRYLFTATARYDGNSKFGPDNKWGIFPSFAGAWRISNESFMRSAHFVDDLKLRLGWGQLGNANLPSYASFTKLSPDVTVDYTGKPVNTIQNSDQIMGNPAIKWERQQQLNMGIDLTAFKGRLRFVYDMYKKDSKDLIMLTPLTVTTGYLNIYSNVGEVSNKGIEVSVGGTIIDRELKWDLDLNWSTNKNRIEKLYGGITERINNQNDPLGAGWWVGRPIGTIYSYVYDGIWQWNDDRQLMADMKEGNDTYYPGENKLRDLDGDDMITTKDRTVIGYTDPKGFGGLSTSLSWKGFTVYAAFNYVYGNKVFNRSYHEYTLGSGYGFQNMTTDMLDRWNIDNQSGTIPRASSNNLTRMPISGRLMQNGSYLRLKTLSLSYNIPERAVRKIGLNSMSVYVSGENIWTLTNYKGTDPESVSTGYNETYPNTKAITFGINITL